jgi:hypothetical protein
MTCEAAQLLIEEELDGTLSPDKAEALRAHLRECAACARARHGLRRIAAALAGPDEFSVADASWEAMVGEAVSRATPRPLSTGVRTVVLLAAAASLVLVCWLGWVRTHRSGPPPNQSAAVLPPGRGPTPRGWPAVGVVQPPAPTHRAAPLRRPPHSTPSRVAQRNAPPSRPPAVAPPGPSPAPPAAQLALDDVYLIYETALTFARDGGRSAAPTDLVAVARVRADSGDLVGAIASYEAAVEASVRSPLPSAVAAQPRPNPGPFAVQVPDPPAALLVAWLPGGE